MSGKQKGNLEITSHQNLGDTVFYLKVDNNLEYQGPRHGLSKTLENYHPKSRLQFGSGVGYKDQVHFTKALKQ